MKSKTKKIFFSFILIILLFDSSSLYGNPIVITYFSELYFDSTGWKLELHKSYNDLIPDTLDGWFLTSTTDTAYFKSGIILQGFLVVTKDNLEKDLFIHPEGDMIVLHKFNPDFYLDELRFGDSISFSHVPTPKFGQSICRRYEYYWYLDNTPTLGSFNDTLNACGTVKGVLKDSLGNIIKKARIIYDYNIGGLIEVLKYTQPDNNGYFSFSCLSGNNVIIIDTSNSTYVTKILEYVYLTIFPETTLSLDISLPMLVSVEHQTIKENFFILEQNYPNPFNPSTKIEYTIPSVGTSIMKFAKLKVYDILGDEVATLVDEIKPPGTYEVEFSTRSFGNTSCLPAGIYFYTLQVGSFRQTRKMLLLK